jgi:hypothetical protein
MATTRTTNSLSATVPELADSANIETAFNAYHDSLANTTIGVAVLGRANDFTGNIAINNGTSTALTTTGATAALFNTNATTLNIGGAAATLTIGATTGTATIRNATVAITNAATIGTTLTVTGAATFNGNITLGNASADTVTVNGTTTFVEDVTIGTAKRIIFEGATDNTIETILTVVDPTTSDKTVTLPNATGYVALTSSTTGVITLGTDTSGNYAEQVSGSDGVSISGAAGEGTSYVIANTDKGSSQNIFKNVAVSGQSTVVADTNNDTLTLAAAGGITLTTDATTDTVTISSSDIYPTAMTYSGGTSAGPVATIIGTNFLSFAASAIPSAAAGASGIVTTQEQAFDGKKIFNGGLTVENSGVFEYYGYSTTAGTSTLTNIPGTVGYATSTPSMLMSVLSSNASTSTGSVGAEFRASTSTGTTHLITFSTASTARGSIAWNGSAMVYSGTSDYRLKENIAPISNATERLMLLKPSRFNFIEFPEKTIDGFIAHEAQAVVPESVTGEKDQLNEDGSPAYQGIDQSKLVPLLTAALQEAVAKIEELTSRVEALEA